MKGLIYIGGIVSISLFLYQCKNVHEVDILGPVHQPEDNLNTADKIELGRKLFFDPRLSVDNSISCSSCHLPQYAFTDRKKVSEGVEGRKTERNAPTILNSGYLKTVMFDAHLESLEKQVIVPIQEHVEMDMNMNQLIEKLRSIPEYQEAAQRIFGRDFDPWVLTRSISAFERSLISDNSPFDQYYYKGDQKAISASAKRGWKLFSEELYCTKCHPAPFFTNFEAENNGLYEDYGNDKGRFRINGDTTDIGFFKVPTLRNIELTYPYMHDGSKATLREVIDHYANGGELHFNQSKEVVPLLLTEEDKEDLINFLNALTDTSYMKNF